jgi:hypothetical protein
VVPSSVTLRYIDLSIELQVMSFYQNRAEDEPPEGVPLLRSVGLGPPAKP